MGIFDLFIVNLDGSNLRQITHGGVQEWPVGWLEDGSFLYTVPGREYGTSFTASTSPAAKAGVLEREHQSLSPDGQYVAIAGLAFGERWQIDISRLDGADRWALANDSLWVSEPPVERQWQWLPLSRPPTRFYHRRADQPAHQGHLPAASATSSTGSRKVPLLSRVGAAVGVLRHRYFDWWGL